MGLRQFVQEAWPIVEPTMPLKQNWHLWAIAEHLEAVTDGQILQLLINVPPGSAKSLLASVFWPCWEWTFRPSGRWLFNSYSGVLTMRDAVKSRRLITSRWYQERWGDRFELAGDQNVKTRYENDRTGYRIATSITAANTGERGDRLVVDDPHAVDKAESLLERTGAVTWFNETLPSRGNDPVTTPTVVVAQRVHMADCSGDVLAKGGWHVLSIPMEFDRTTSVDFRDALKTDEHPIEERATTPCPLPTRDPRTVDGALYDTHRYTRATVEHLKFRLGAYAYASQFQQNPTPRAGSIIDPGWFQPLPRELIVGTRILFVDTAFSGKQTADYTAAAELDVDGQDRMVLRSIWRQRVDESRLDQALADHIIATRPKLVCVELPAFRTVSVKNLIDRVSALLRKKGLAIPILGVDVDGDKIMRAQIIGTYGRAGLLYANQSAAWWSSAAAEMAAFPNGAHDDQVDAISGVLAAAVQRIIGNRVISALVNAPQGAALKQGGDAAPKPTPANTQDDPLRILLGVKG